MAYAKAQRTLLGSFVDHCPLLVTAMKVGNCLNMFANLLEPSMSDVTVT